MISHEVTNTDLLICACFGKMQCSEWQDAHCGGREMQTWQLTTRGRQAEAEGKRKGYLKGYLMQKAVNAPPNPPTK